MNKVVIPCFFHTEETQIAKDTGLEYSYEQCDLRPRMFYNIDSICPEYDNGKEYTEIISGGMTYISPWTMSEVDYVIDQANWQVCLQ